jgi:hypothetical protein
MSQTTSLIAYANDIDNGNVLFNLSAWMGGWAGQNDSASVSIYFQNSASQIIGNRTTIGPILDTDRGGITATVFRQITGSVPVNTRWVTTNVNMTKYSGADDDGSIDNIRFELKYI